MEAIKKVKKSVDKSLEKVRKKPWAEPLGKAMSITGKIVSECGNFIPGAGIIGGALSFGSSMLNPEPTMEELKKQLDEVNEGMKSISTENAMIRGLMEKSMRQEIQKLEDKIANPCSEILSRPSLTSSFCFFNSSIVGSGFSMEEPKESAPPMIPAPGMKLPYSDTSSPVMDIALPSGSAHGFFRTFSKDSSTEFLTFLMASILRKKLR